MRRQAKASSARTNSSEVSGRVPRRTLLFLLVGVLAIALGQGSAFAGQTRDQIDVFDGSATPGGSFDPRGLAIDQEADALYVLDTENEVVQKLDFDGNPQPFSALGTSVLDGKGTGDCPTTEADCDETPDNTLGLSSGFAGIVVDNSGTATDGFIYVATDAPDRVYTFDPSGEFLWSIDGSGPQGTPSGNLGTAAGVAVGPDGVLYVAGFFAQEVFKFTTSASGASYQSTYTIFNQPKSIAVLSTGALHVKVGNGAVETFDPSGISQDLRSGNDGDITANRTNDHVFNDNGTVIAEEDASGALLLRFGPGTLVKSRSVAVDEGSGNIFAGDSATGEVRVYGPVVPTVAPSVTLDPASSVTATTAHLSGSVDPNGYSSSARFEYSTDNANWTVVSNEDVGFGSDPVAVEADLSGLNPNSHYYFRLIATNFAGDETTQSAELDTPAVPPVVEVLDAGYLTETSALIGGVVNPRFAATTYYVEYATDDSYADSIKLPASEDASAGSGGSDVIASQEATGLTPNTTYHYRVVAESIGGTTTGDDHTFTTLAPPVAEGPGLPDGRVYEKVSPLDKGTVGASAIASPREAVSVAQASADGDAVAWTSQGVFSEGQAGLIVNQYVSRREGDGWTTQGINPPVSPAFVPSSGGGTIGTSWFSDDLRYAVLSSYGKVNSGDPDQIQNLYLWDSEGDTYRLLTQQHGVTLPANLQNDLSLTAPEFLGATDNGKHVVFFTDWKLLSSAPDQGLLATYEWYDDGSPSGNLRYVGILPDDTPASCSQSLGLSTAYYQINSPYNGVGEAGFSGDAEFPNGFPARPRVISEDGSNVYFRYDPVVQDCEASATSSAGSDTAGPLFVRENGTSTTQLPADADYPRWPHPRERLTPDGRYRAFESTARLTLYDNDGHRQIYLHDSVTDQTVCISCSQRTEKSTENASFVSYVSRQEDDMGGKIPDQGTRNISPDGKRVFFDSWEALVPEDTNGKVDVYEWKEGRVHLISSGSSRSNSQFLDASESGDDVFFFTGEPLVLGDKDDEVDVYDAKVGGIEELAPVPGCSGDECQGVPSAPPTFNTPATSTYSGPGNEATPKAKKKRKAKAKKRHRGKKRHGQRAKSGKRG